MKKELFNEGWYFYREDVGPAAALAHGDAVSLPHTWNAVDGQDGKNDYYRGKCWYVKKFNVYTDNELSETWIEFEAIAMHAELYLNGQSIGSHTGGYSAFRIELTPFLRPDENILAVCVDNSKNETCYPQKADFTFYGGIYRDAYLIQVPCDHFALNDYGSCGLYVNPIVSGNLKSATVFFEAKVSGTPDNVTFALGEHMITAPVVDHIANASVQIENVHLWNGIADPYLYSVSASLPNNESVTASFGCRKIEFDADKGFFLNGKSYRLCGAARHQDRQGVGNAISKQHQEEDIDLMLEMGANTVRLAHYQHSQYFYDLCDRKGLIVWAEIPYITEHLVNARENSLSQMRELILQNRNHPSIICWGLSNEITATGGTNEDMIENHRLLQELCHSLDNTRPTTMAHVFMLNPDDPFVQMSDICSYNLYYGWYIGELDQNDSFFDEFHKKHPDRVIGLSEFGADANPKYQSANPQKGDWSEGYQALYHEHMLKMWSERPFIWAMHCWNMFDFGADGRDEGGKPGQNQKGLVTFDRKIKKDAFYIYKAYLSNDPFVHLCGRRYQDRSEDTTVIKVYSNQPYVTLLVDGKRFETKNGSHVFTFSVPISEEHEIEAISGNYSDHMTIRKVAEGNPSYVKDAGEIVNWFDCPREVLKEGYYSILDTIEDLKENAETAKILAEISALAASAYGDVAKNITMPEEIQRQMDKMTFEQMLKQAGKVITPEIVKKCNYELNQIPKQ